MNAVPHNKKEGMDPGDSFAEPSDSKPFEDEVGFEKLKGLRVLVVEDNKLNWVVLKKYLASWEVSCEHAENGAIALEMIATNDYDMVFMDLQMPVMDGITAMDILRNEKGFTKPVIAITANAYVNEEYNIEASGFSGSILKPFHKKELAATMISFFNRPAEAAKTD